MSGEDAGEAEINSMAPALRKLTVQLQRQIQIRQRPLRVSGRTMEMDCGDYRGETCEPLLTEKASQRRQVHSNGS